MRSLSYLEEKVDELLRQHKHLQQVCEDLRLKLKEEETKSGNLLQTLQKTDRQLLALQLSQIPQSQEAKEQMQQTLCNIIAAIDKVIKGLDYEKK